MSDTVIKAENLSKKYLIGHQRQEGYQTLRDTITQKTRDWGRRLMHPFRASSGQPLGDIYTTEEFWALNDVSFEIKQGDRVGIIGRNGAGKSTLLKLLSRITEPTSGRITIDGRVASLLEVGTGFHPELSGRENIFLNGAVLGMTKAEIRKKFDEIVAFAEVDKFLDTPVKRYSSGMYVRLAFAVAAHLEPEILIVDEVLAVGDGQFQKKCLGKMEEVGKEGRTVLFVSHNMAAVKALCDSSILLWEGKVKLTGETSHVIDNYLLSFAERKNKSLDQRTDRTGTGNAIFNQIAILDKNNKQVNCLNSGNCYKIRLHYLAYKNLRRVKFKISIYNSHDHTLLHFDSSIYVENMDLKIGNGFVDCHIKKLPLSSGNYRINIGLIQNDDVIDHIVYAMSFSVEDGDFFGNGKLLSGLKEICLIEHHWESL